MKYEWIPKVRVGPLRFNAVVSPYVKNGTLVPAPFDDEINNLGNTPSGDRYTYPNDYETSVYVEDERIESIACNDRCILRGQNLIGLDYERVRELIDSEPAGEPDIQPVIDELLDVYEFEETGAQVWVNEGKVVTIILYQPSCEDGSD